MQFTLQGVHLVDAMREETNSTISVEGTQITAVGTSPGGNKEAIDASDMIVMPGFIDVHTHGGGGFNLHTTDVQEIRNYIRWVPTTGVTSFLIAVVGTPGALPEQQLTTAVQAIQSQESGAEALGIHLEGPYINVKRKGAHAPSWLRIPDAAETERILDLTQGYLRLITLAPELPGAHQMIQRLVEVGVTVSIGHTDATYDQAKEAIALGIRHATHCFNAMPPLLHRKPGTLGAVIEAQEVLGELIGDGVHVHPAAMSALVKALGANRTIVVTDALAGAGMPDMVFEFAGQFAQVICGAARLADGTITGSVLTMDQALRNMLEMTPATLQEAVAMLTYNPARSAHAADRKGLLQPGHDADLLLFDKDLHLQATLCRGQVTFATEAWQERLQAVKQGVR